MVNYNYQKVNVIYYLWERILLGKKIWGKSAKGIDKCDFVRYNNGR